MITFIRSRPIDLNKLEEELNNTFTRQWLSAGYEIEKSEVYYLSIESKGRINKTLRYDLKMTRGNMWVSVNCIFRENMQGKCFEISMTEGHVSSPRQSGVYFLEIYINTYNIYSVRNVDRTLRHSI